jgi:hypothetical protein
VANGQCRCENVATIEGENQFPKVVQGVKFQNGIEVIKMPAPPCRLIDLVTRSPA